MHFWLILPEDVWSHTFSMSSTVRTCCYMIELSATVHQWLRLPFLPVQSSRSSTWQPRSLRAARPTSPQSLWAVRACEISASAPISKIDWLKSRVRATMFLNSMQDCFWNSGKQDTVDTSGISIQIDAWFGFQKQQERHHTKNILYSRICFWKARTQVLGKLNRTIALE